MFHLYQSDHLEDLAALLAAVRRQNPLPDPFAAEEVVVPSHGMRRFLSHYLARETGIAANMRFALPAQLMWRWLREQVGAVPENDPFAPEVLRWRLLALFDRPQFAADESFQAARGALGAYLQRGESARYALAGQLADVFDQYLVYRADWLETWKQGKTLPDLPESQLWQAELWRSLDSGEAEGRHRAALWHRLAAALAAEKRHFVAGAGVSAAVAAGGAPLRSAFVCAQSQPAVLGQNGVGGRIAVAAGCRFVGAGASAAGGAGQAGA